MPIKPTVPNLQCSAWPQDAHAAFHSKSFDEPEGELSEGSQAGMANVQYVLLLPVPVIRSADAHTFLEFDGVLHPASATSRVSPHGSLNTSVQRTWLLDAGQLQRLLQAQLETPAEELAQGMSTAQRRAWQADCNLRARIAEAVGG